MTMISNIVGSVHDESGGNNQCDVRDGLKECEVCDIRDDRPRRFTVCDVMDCYVHLIGDFCKVRSMGLNPVHYTKM